MKKKQYIIPELEIDKMDDCLLLAGSVVGDAVTNESLDSGIDALGHEFDFEPSMSWEDEDDF